MLVGRPAAGGDLAAQPGAHRLRAARRPGGSWPVLRPGRARRGRHQVGHAGAPRAAARPRGWPRRRAACSTRSACRARASTRSSTSDLPWLAERGARVVVAIAGSTVEEYARAGPTGCGAPGRGRWSRSTSPARTSRTAAWSSPATRRAAAEVVARSGQHAARRAGARQARRPTSPTSSPSPGPCVDAGADGLSMINTLLGMAIDTDRRAAPARRGHRRAVRPGDPAGGGALRLAGARRRCPRCRSSASAAWAPAGTRRARAGRGQRGLGRHRQLPRPSSGGRGRRGPRALPRRPGRRSPAELPAMFKAER